MALAQKALDCKSEKEVIEMVESHARAILMEFKRQIEEALEELVTRYRGARWVKIRESTPTPLVFLYVEQGQVTRSSAMDIIGVI